MKRTIQMIQQKFNPHVSVAIDTLEYQNGIEFFNVRTNVLFKDENNLEIGPIHFDFDQGSVYLDLLVDITDDHQTGFDLDLNAKNLNLKKLLPKFNYFNVSLLKSLSDLPDDMNVKIKLNGIIDDVNGLLPNAALGTIHFDSDHYNHLNGNVSIQPDSTSHQPLTQLNLSGSPHLFNDFFQNKDFIFQESGDFRVSFEYKGDVASIEHLVEDARVDLIIEDAAVRYKAADIVVHLDTIALDYSRDTALYKLYLYSDSLDREIYIDGEIDNLSNLLFDNSSSPPHTAVNIYSPVLNLSHALHIFDTQSHTQTKSPEEGNEHRIDNKLKNLIKQVYTSFNPAIHIKLDTFIVNDQFTLKGFHTGVEFKDSTHLILDQTDFNFLNGDVSLNAAMDNSTGDESPFEINLVTKELQLQELLHSLNYLNSQSIENADTLDGRITLALDLQGSLESLALSKSSINGTLDFDLHDLRVEGIDIVDDIATKIHGMRFLHDLKFAPITNTISITGSRIDIPEMEIMTTAFDFFVEGHIDQEKGNNLWLSVPLDNLRRVPITTVPQKRGYQGSKRKIFVELLPNEEGKTGLKFRLTKKKYFEQRGTPELYNAYKASVKENIKRLNREKKKK